MNNLKNIFKALGLCLLLGALNVLACSPPTSNPNTRYAPFRNHYYAGEIVRYSCQEGFRAAGGSSMRRCLQSKTWTEQPLRCARKYDARIKLLHLENRKAESR